MGEVVMGLWVVCGACEMVFVGRNCAASPLLGMLEGVYR